MKIHHMDCGTMRPFGGGLLSGSGHPFKTAGLVAHCLLVETPADGLVLVDTGLGTACVERPAATLGRAFMLATRPLLDPEQTALSQVRALGHDPRDVRHIILTHLDLDHAGGLPDFPEATVHVHEPEFRAAMSPPTFAERHRYKACHWAHGAQWATYPTPGPAAGSGSGDRWFGFDAVRPLRGLPDDILLVPLSGHTRGHVGIAIRADDRWLLHAGDAYFFRGEVDPVRPHCTPGLRVFQNIVQTEGRARHASQERLRGLAAEHGGEVDIISAHDPVELLRHSG